MRIWAKTKQVLRQTISRTGIDPIEKLVTDFLAKLRPSNSVKYCNVILVLSIFTDYTFPI